MIRSVCVLKIKAGMLRWEKTRFSFTFFQKESESILWKNLIQKPNQWWKNVEGSWGRDSV